MITKVLGITMLSMAAAAPAPQQTHNLPVLFQFSQPGHNVAVFRGADLKKAIASGLVSGFGSLGNGGANADAAAAAKAAADAKAAAAARAAAEAKARAEARAAAEARKAAEARAAAAAAKAAADARAAAAARAAAYKPAPVVYRPAPVVIKATPAPVIYKPAPAPIVYKTAPTTVYKSAPAYVEPSYADIPAKYDYEYAVKDDYTSNNFGAAESRDGYLTNGKYYVSLPDGRLQTVTYVVDGGAGYVPVVEYSGEAQYPAEQPSASYSG